MKLFLLIALTLPALTCQAVEIIAHRGASADAPENTVASAKLAWARNTDAVEIDVYLSRDGQIVVIHDGTTERTAGKDAPVVDQTFAELQQLDAGAWKAPRWKGEQIPSLPQVIDTVPPGKRLVIEIKCGPEIVLPLKRTLEKSTLSTEQIVIIGFSYDTMTRVKKAMPRYEAYWLSSFKKSKVTGAWIPSVNELIRKAKAARLDGVNVSHKGPINASFVDQVKAANLKILVYTVNDAETARRLVSVGVQGLTTDRPGWLRKQLE